MCELMGLSFDRPISADFSIQAFSLRDQENADGWGLAWYPDQSAAIVKEPLSWRKSNYSSFLEKYEGLQARIYIAHVRHKTVGGTVTHADTHPFCRELAGHEYCFAHNGTIQGFPSLTLGMFHPLGGTDSEHVFCYLMAGLAERDKPLSELSDWRWLHKTLAELNRFGRLNCLLSDGKRLLGYRDFHGWKGLSLRKLRFHPQDERAFSDASMEVTICCEEDNQGYVIATYPLSATGWHPLAPGNLVVLDGGSLRFSEVIGPYSESISLNAKSG